MRPGWWVRLVLGMLVGGVGDAGAQSAPPTSPFQYVVFGMERVTIGSHARVEAGEVGTNLGVLSLGAGARILGGASAFEIHVRPGAGARRLNCLFIQG